MGLMIEWKIVKLPLGFREVDLKGQWKIERAPVELGWQWRLYARIDGNWKRVDGYFKSRDAAKEYVESDDKPPAPYPFCHHPDKCAGMGYCKREIACNN